MEEIRKRKDEKEVIETKGLERKDEKFAETNNNKRKSKQDQIISKNRGKKVK